MLPVGSIPNQISAIIGGRADFALVPNLAIQGALAEHKLHVIGWLGDQIPLQLNVIITSTRTADSRADIVRHFLGALSKGVKDYREAFVGPDEKRQDGPTAAAILEIASKHMNQPPEIVSKGIAYVDPNLRLDPVTFKQLEWFKSRGMVKPEVDASKVIDARYTKSPQ